jgi:hypothetical protein
MTLMMIMVMIMMMLATCNATSCCFDHRTKQTDTWMFVKSPFALPTKV